MKQNSIQRTWIQTAECVSFTEAWLAQKIHTLNSVLYHHHKYTSCHKPKFGWDGKLGLGLKLWLLRTKRQNHYQSFILYNNQPSHFLHIAQCTFRVTDSFGHARDKMLLNGPQFWAPPGSGTIDPFVHPLLTALHVLYHMQFGLCNIFKNLHLKNHL